MKPFLTSLVCFLSLFWGTALLEAQNKPNEYSSLTAPLFQEVDQEFDAQKAYQTVAFVEQYWRVVGNKGFNKSIYFVENLLKDAGFIEEDKAKDTDRLTYRIEHRPLKNPTWEPVNAHLSLADGTPLLDFKTNRNMMTINSYSTNGVQEFEVIPVERNKKGFSFDKEVKGKVVYAEGPINRLFYQAVIKHGAAGVIAYRMPSYLQPERNKTSIQFSRVPLDTVHKRWGVLLSYEANEKLKQALEQGNNRVRIDLKTRIYKSEELTLVAELRGSKYPGERLVFSAHVQEPGANDNATGVGTLAEMASTASRLLKEKKIDPERTLTFLFGDEIVSTNRYITDNPERAKGIKWGVSLDMTGEDTQKTGGTFLIEKMPDPAAIWTRGKEKHSEWGGRPLTKKDMKPHYLNDFILNRFLERGAAKNWVVKTNPFEGGSDHAPFIRNDIPGLLLWHFTDQFYHTDNDRLDKVSSETMKNVGTGALVSALILTGNEENAFNLILRETKEAALNRLKTEFELSEKELAVGGDLAKETDILDTWGNWYAEALKMTSDVFHSPHKNADKRIKEAIQAVNSQKDKWIKKLKEG